VKRHRETASIIRAVIAIRYRLRRPNDHRPAPELPVLTKNKNDRFFTYAVARGRAHALSPFLNEWDTMPKTLTIIGMGACGVAAFAEAVTRLCYDPGDGWNVHQETAD